MKKIVLVFIAGLFISLCACGQNIETRDTTGKKIVWEEPPHRWIILNYWASWCHNCYEEVPELNAFYKAHHGKDVLLLGVNADHTPLRYTKRYMQEMNIQFPVLRDDPASRLKLGSVPALPATFIFTPHGKLVRGHYGQLTKAGLEELVNELDAQRK